MPVRASEGCSRAPAPPDTIISSETLDVDGVTRTYRLAVPPEATSPAPLVVALHGVASTAADFEATSELTTLGPSGGYITVLADGDPLAGWELSPEGADARFLAALLDHVESTTCVDLDRVYGVGMSMGAWKIAATACADPGHFAALALVTVEVFPGECEPMPVIAFHGTADVVVPFGDGGEDVVGISDFNASLPGARTNIAAWAHSNGCAAGPADTRIGPDVVVSTYGDCQRGNVLLHTIEGGGHTWPGTPRPDPFGQVVTQTISATALSLEFFKDNARTTD